MDIELLKSKPINILVTNCCNLSCAGCTQHCGQFNERFFITLDQFRKNVKVAVKLSHHPIGLFGGEPCLHPEFQKILDIVNYEFPKNIFLLYTNGLLLNKFDKFLVSGGNMNVFLKIHIKNDHTTHRATMIAPIDL